MDHPKGADETGDLRPGFDRRVRLEFHSAKISSDGGLLLFRELDEVLGLHDTARTTVVRGVQLATIVCILWLACCGSRSSGGWLDMMM